MAVNGYGEMIRIPGQKPFHFLMPFAGVNLVRDNSPPAYGPGLMPLAIRRDYGKGDVVGVINGDVPDQTPVVLRPVVLVTRVKAALAVPGLSFPFRPENPPVPTATDNPPVALSIRI